MDSDCDTFLQKGVRFSLQTAVQVCSAIAQRSFAVERIQTTADAARPPTRRMGKPRSDRERRRYFSATVPSRSQSASNGASSLGRASASGAEGAGSKRCAGGIDSWELERSHARGRPDALVTSQSVKTVARGVIEFRRGRESRLVPVVGSQLMRSTSAPRSSDSRKLALLSGSGRRFGILAEADPGGFEPDRQRSTMLPVFHGADRRCSGSSRAPALEHELDSARVVHAPRSRSLTSLSATESVSPARSVCGDS